MKKNSAWTDEEVEKLLVKIAVDLDVGSVANRGLGLIIIKVVGEEEMHVDAEEQDRDDNPRYDDAPTRAELLALERYPDRYETFRRQQDQSPRRHLPRYANDTIQNLVVVIIQDSACICQKIIN